MARANAETKHQIVSKFVSDVLHIRAESCNLRETWTPVGKASGSLGSLYKCQLSVLRNTEAADSHVSFIAKFELNEDNPLHEFSVSNNLFNREVGFYEYVSTRRLELKVPLFYFSSSSPASSDHERYLIIEDLTSTTYSPQFEVGCSYEQCVAVVTELAKVHSLDVALPPESALHSSPGNKTLQDLYQSGIQGLLQHVRDSSHLVSHQWEILTHQLPVALKAAYEEAEGHTCMGRPHLHLTHGDMWSGNVLFSSLPCSTSQLVALVDWQFAGLEHCPLFDLMTFLASSVDTHIRQQHSTTLLTLYLDSRSDLGTEDAEYDSLKRIFNKHFLVVGTAFAVASWEIFRVKEVNQDNLSPGCYGIGNFLLLNRFWDLLTDYCNCC